MANPFLNEKLRDVETAIMLEQAIIHDIGRAVAYTDGKRIFMNTEDNLFNILPAYDHGMLKWLLWHEKMHLELKHHNRFFKYVKELDADKTKDEFHVTKDEVNIIMDIVVHDWMCKKFPELIPVAELNLAQMRDKNSLKYTFETFTLEEMLDEYAKHKKPDDKEGDGTPSEDETDEKKEKKDGEGAKDKSEKGHGEGGSGSDKDKSEPKPEDKAPEMTDDKPEEPAPAPKSERHDETDWSKLKDQDTKEFIERDEGERIMEAVEKLKKKKFKLAKLTETLNGLVTSTRKRSYAMPSTVHLGHGVLLKGSTPGRTQLYLCFDASGSMSWEMNTFKDIISKSIPQAMDTPTEWFSGYGASDKLLNEKGRTPHDYYKGKFSDFMKIHADSGYGDDGDRTIEMCFKAEQMGYSPIGITDGGGRISWSKDMIKQLKRTVLVGDNKEWLEAVKAINPKVQILDV